MPTDDRAPSTGHAVTQIPWARSSIGDQAHVASETLQKGLTVNLIATKRANFETCAQDEMLSHVVERNRHNGFDFLPVVEPTLNCIAGLIEIAPFMQGEIVDARVNTLMHPLSEENLLGADASILIFVRNADHHKCRLIVSEHEISGLVSLSDLQRLPVRAALFGLITYLEIIMINVIRHEFDAAEKWLNLLSDERREKLRDEIKQAWAHDSFVDALLFTQFADKATIIRKSLWCPIGTKQFKDEFKKIQSLRDRLAHANDYAASPEAACEVCRTVRLIDQWNDQLSRLLQTSQI